MWSGPCITLRTDLKNNFVGYTFRKRLGLDAIIEYVQPIIRIPYQFLRLYSDPEIYGSAWTSRWQQFYVFQVFNLLGL